MDSKWVGKSLTVWGGLVAILPGLAIMFGFELGDVADLQAAGNAAINGIATIGGFVMLVLGRKKAASDTRKVTLLPKFK